MLRPASSILTFKEFVEEWWQFCLSLPMLLAFIPGCDVQVLRGFIALSSAPHWFQEAIGAAIIFAFGRRTLRGLRLPSRLGKRTTTAPITNPPAQGAGS